jgi:hypothetical protein
MARVQLIALDTDSRRGSPLHVRGDVHAEGEPCEHIAVEISLRDARTRRESFLGTLATDEGGGFTGALVVPSTIALGDYDVVARTPGDTRCAAGATP